MALEAFSHHRGHPCRITEGFYSIKGVHTITGRIYIDGSFSVGISLIGVFPLFARRDYFSIWQTGRLQQHLESGGKL